MIKKYLCVIRVFLSEVLLSGWKSIQDLLKFLGILLGTSIISGGLIVGAGKFTQWIIMLIWQRPLSLEVSVALFLFIILSILLIMCIFSFFKHLIMFIHKKWKKSKEECWDLFQENTK